MVRCTLAAGAGRSMSVRTDDITKKYRSVRGKIIVRGERCTTDGPRVRQRSHLVTGPSTRLHNSVFRTVSRSFPFPIHRFPTDPFLVSLGAAAEFLHLSTITAVPPFVRSDNYGRPREPYGYTHTHRPRCRYTRV